MPNRGLCVTLNLALYDRYVYYMYEISYSSPGSPGSFSQENEALTNKRHLHCLHPDKQDFSTSLLTSIIDRSQAVEVEHQVSNQTIRLAEGLVGAAGRLACPQDWVGNHRFWGQ